MSAIACGNCSRIIRCRDVGAPVNETCGTATRFGLIARAQVPAKTPDRQSLISSDSGLSFK